MIPGARLVVLGRQGAGKGTQCVRLSRHYIVPHISTGDILRAAVREGTDLGQKAEDYMSRGELLPDDIIIGIVEERLAQHDTRLRGFVLDGFPRTVAQAQALHDATTTNPVELVVNLEVGRTQVLSRLASRRVCDDCGANYSLEDRPRHQWSCDECGGEVVHRQDDTEEAINRRLDIYEQETFPLLKWYGDRGLLLEVDGTGTPEDVFDRLVRSIDRTRT